MRSVYLLMMKVKSPWLTLLAAMALLLLAPELILAWIYPPYGYTSGAQMQQLGVGGTTLFLPSNTEISYAIFVRQNEKVVLELKNYIGNAQICVLVDGVNRRCSDSKPAPVRLEHTFNFIGNTKVYIKADRATTAILSWDKQTCIGPFCSSTNEGKNENNPMPIVAGFYGGVEATFGSENSHYYLHYVDSNPQLWNLPHSFIASIRGSSGTDFDLYIYDGNNNLVARAIRSTYPDYVYVKASSTGYYRIKVHAYTKADINEYNLQVARPLIRGHQLSTTTVKPGQQFTIRYTILNPFRHNIDVAIGASTVIHDGFQERIYDLPATRVTLAPGENQVQVNYVMPKDAFLGRHKLLIALWGELRSDGTVDIFFDGKAYDNALTVAVPQNPEITYTSASPSTLPPGATTTVTVKWIFYNACPGGCVVKANAFGSWAKTTQLAVIYDGRDGNYGNEQSKSFTVQLPSDIPLGTHYVRVGFCYAYDFAKSYDGLARCTYKDIPIQVQKISTAIIVTPSSFTLTSGQSRPFEAQLIDSSGKPLANKKVTWSSNIGSCNPVETYTDAGGYAYTTCTAPTVSSPTTMTVTAAFGGDYQYVQSSKTVSGTVNPPSYSVTVDPNGGRVYVDGTSITAPKTYTWTYGSTHTLDPDSGYSPSDGVRLIFTQWSDGSTADPRTITVTGSAQYVAMWRREYRLTISVTPSGAGTTSPAVGQYWYAENSAVTVTASPNSGYVFDHWEVNGVNAGSSPTITVTMDRPINLVAVFKQRQEPKYGFRVVVRGGDNRIYHRVCTDAACESWSAIAASAADTPGVVLLSNKLYLVIRGPDDGILFGTLDLQTGSFSGWQRIGGSTPSRPALTTDGSRLYLVVRGRDDRLYLRVYTISSATWSSWSVLPGSTIDGPAAAVMGGRLHLVVRGRDGASIYHGQYDLSSGQWLGWALISGSTPSVPTLVSDGTKLWLAVRGRDNRIYIRTWSGSWGSWERIPTGSTDASPAIKVIGSYLVVVVKANGGTSIYYCFKDLTTNSWSSWTRMSGSTPSSPLTP
ncbi:MAG: hypothetical protein QW706_09260 [Candidatus Nezhaarchaeales archaeon]